MAKTLPYFKFYCSEWADGDITLEDMKTQGVFINICSYYWSQECEVFEEKLQKRFKNYSKQIENLKKEKIIFLEKGKVIIKFLDKQWQDRGAIKYKNQQNGKAGGRPKKTQSVNFGNPDENPDITNIEEIREEEIRRDKIKEIKEKINKNNFIDDATFYAFLDTRKRLGVSESILDYSVALILRELEENKNIANKVLEMAIKQNSKNLTWAIEKTRVESNQDTEPQIYITGRKPFNSSVIEQESSEPQIYITKG